MHGLWLNAVDVTRRAPPAGGTEAGVAVVGTDCTSLVGLRGKIVTAAMS